MDTKPGRLQLRLLHLLIGIAGLGLFFACLAGHLGPALQMAAVLIGAACLMGAILFAYGFVIRFILVSLPRLVLDSLRKKK